METKIYNWHGREFVEIVGEGRAGTAPESAVRELFERFDAALKSHGLSLDNAMRVRVWGRDREARMLATAARAKILSGRRRAASSSFISEDWFDSNAAAGLELLALRPLDSSVERRPVDFEPARNYLCYLDCDRWLFFSGFTSEAPTLENQTEEVLATIDGALTRARSDWGKVVKLSALVQRGHDLEAVRRVLAKSGRHKIPEIEFSFVDGFAGEKYLLEIEATALKKL
ncbi:MAG TPA: RidA family protein [Verrucomicrobiae bacterium]|nr:RidA family protein [Verrucomicrobiae bacterium]